MKIFRLALPVLAGVAMAVGTLTVFARGQAAPASPPIPNAWETSLLPFGAAQEIHVDSTGTLWITESDADTLRQFNPATGVYTLYTGMHSPGDAQIGPDGNLWWTGDDYRYLARMNVDTRLVTTWTVPALSPLGLAFDSNGRVWFMDDGMPGAYRFDPNSNELCTVNLLAVSFGQGAYITEHNGALWLGDYINGGLGRITPTTNAYTFWPINLVSPAAPHGIAFAPNGDVWYAEYSQGKIGRLEPNANRARLYGPANLAQPAQVAYHAGKIWFTQEFYGNVGFIDPAVAVGGTPQTVTPSTYTLVPVCSSSAPTGTFTAAFTTGVSSFSPVALGVNAQTEGTVYTLPVNSATFGLAFTGFNLWVADLGRDKLVRLDTAAHLYLPLVKK